MLRNVVVVIVVVAGRMGQRSRWLVMLMHGLTYIHTLLPLPQEGFSEEIFFLVLHLVLFLWLWCSVCQLLKLP